MPVMIRPKNKARKIAYQILGVPANILDKKTPKEKRISKKINQQDTRLVR